MQLHHHSAKRLHNHIASKVTWYQRWHKHKYHAHAHYSVLGVFLATVSVIIGLQYQKVSALSDLTDTWDFATSSMFSFDTGTEASGTSARLKAQNYTPDANTKALYHLDEASGNSVSDGSSNANTAAVSGTANWTTGNLNNAHTFNGTDTSVSAPDSTSLSLSQANTLEAWTKFSNPFSTGSHDNSQSVIDKGSYKLYYDNQTGKITYEMTNASATTWTQRAGNDINGSWDTNGKLAVLAQVTSGSDMYAGLGNAVGDAEVWKWNGTTWAKVGGDGVNSSWPDNTYESVRSLAVHGTTLYAGLGSGVGDGEVWSCDMSTGCTDWTKIGGDGVNSGWPVNTIEEVESMTVMGGTLYVGLGLSTNDARIYRWNGTSWTWVGGFGVSGFTAFPTGYEGVFSLSNDGTNVYAGMGNSAGDADVWRLNGTTWTQIGGDALSSSWAAGTYDQVVSMTYMSGNLYAGLGLTAGEAEVWRYNGTTWTQIGGDNLNSSWDNISYEAVYSLANDGTNIYAGLGSSAGDNEVYSWNGTTWTKIGGDGLNSGFTATHIAVQALAYGNSQLYAGTTATGANAETWSYNGTTWTRIGGGYINKSWGYFNLQNVESMTVSGDYLYAGTGSTVAGNALVWRYNGTTWEMIGGQGIDGSWPAYTYEDVLSMVSYKGELYVGLGTTANDAEVWKWNGTAWTKVGGDSINSGWTTNYEEVYSMSVYSGNLYAGVGNSANDAEVWRYNGTTWTKVGGDGINSGWTTNYERVSSMTTLNGNLYAALGNSTGDAEVWRYNGTTWTKVGGDGVSSSWNTNYEQIETMAAYNGKLYAGTGNSTGDAELWEYNGTTWTKVGGDGLNNSWIDAQYEYVKSITTYNGKLYVGLGNGTGEGEVWAYDGISSWSQVGGAVNGSWPANTIEVVQSLSVYKGKLYAGLGNSANADAAIWSYGNNAYLQSTTTNQDTNWHHVAATYDGATAKLYIDGSLDNQIGVSLSIPDDTTPLMIGSSIGTGDRSYGSGNFQGSLDEIRISDSARPSLNAKPYTSTPQTITLSNAVRMSGVWHWDEFNTNETVNGGTITYRLSDDGGATWKYWNGTQWTTSFNLSQANASVVIDTNISTFPATFYGIKWQAVLSGDGSQQVTLHSVSVLATSDINAPASNVANLTAYKSNGGDTLLSNNWTNGAAPYFTWLAGSDTDSGVKGYCVYLGKDNSADPVTTKGILGNSPVYTGNNCQFIVDVTQLNTAISGYLSSALATDNDPYYLTIKTIDNAANITASSQQFQFRFDNTPPTNPGFITAPSGFINTKDVTLSWPTSGGSAPNDANSGVSGLQYKIGGGNWYGDIHSGTGDSNDLLVNDGSYTTMPTPDYNDIAEGINNVYFRTWDQAGNITSTYVTAAIKVNTSGAPSEPQSLTALPTSNTQNAFSFVWGQPSTFVGNASAITYCYTINTLPSNSTCTYTSPGVTSLGSGPYATQPGTNTLYVAARDESSNINYANYASVTFSANTPAPGIPLNTDIVDVSIKSTSNWRLALTWDVPSYTGAGIHSYKVFRSTNNITFTYVGSSSSTTYIDANLIQQQYYYRVQACDSTNNCGANSAVVNELPTGKFTTPAALVSKPVVSNITTKKATISWVTDRPSDSKIAIGTSSGKYSSSEVGNSEQRTNHEIEIDNLSAGTTYYYVAKWTDEDGNTGQSQEFYFTTAPAPTLKEVSAVKVGLTNATIQFTSKDAAKVAIYYGKSEAFGGLKTVNTSLSESTYSTELAGLDDGSKYFYKLVSYDSENNAYESSIESFATKSRPRISNVRFQPIEGEPTSTQSVSWSTNVAASSSVTYTRAGGATKEQQVSEAVTEHTIIIRDLEDNSEYSLIVQSRDQDGNLATSDPQIFKTALDTRPPKISNVVAEASIRGVGAEARGQVVLSWQTDEPSTSQVAYAEGSGATVFNTKTAEDSALSTEHVVIVSDLPTSRVYSLQPISNDKAANKATGEVQSAIIGRASDSVLTIVLNSLKKVFGI